MGYKKGTIVKFKEGFPALHAMRMEGLLSNEGNALGKCTVYGLVLLGDESDGDEYQISIHKVSYQGKQQYFLDTVQGYVIPIPRSGVDNEVVMGWTDKEDDFIRLLSDEKARDSFYRIEKFEKVKITQKQLLKRYFKLDADQWGEINDHCLVLALVEDVSMRETSGMIEVKLRSVVNLQSKAILELTKLQQQDQFGNWKDVKMFVSYAEIEPASKRDEMDCLNLQALKKHDKLAIWLPDVFYRMPMGGNYSFQTVKSLFKKGELGHSSKGQFGGQDALLEYRSWLTEFVLKRLKEITYAFAKTNRRSEIMRQFNDDIDQYLLEGAAFADSTKPIGWAAPGSLEPTSDIDLNTWGDETEWATKVFNFLMGQMHEQHESGEVYDVNFYAKDFKPKIGDAVEVRGEHESVKEFEPIYDHVITTETIAAQDDEAQLHGSLLKMRRYMKEHEWNYFIQVAKQELVQVAGFETSFRPGMRVAKEAYKAYQIELLKLMWMLCDSKEAILQGEHPYSVPQLLEKPEKFGVFQFRNWIEDEQLSRYRLRAENRKYEEILYDGNLSVSELRRTFNYMSFKAKVLKASMPNEGLDEAYYRLRSRIVSSLYFANEGYCTEGAIIAVVVGKQGISRGVTMQRDTKAKKHNIAYTDIQLICSMNEQLGDTFKESTRQYLEMRKEGKNEQEAYGESIVAVGKYLHRFFNAVKHFYKNEDEMWHELLATVIGPVVDENRKDEYGDWNMQLANHPAYPRWLLPEDSITLGGKVMNPFEVFEICRRACGFGLEELKKFEMSNFDKPYKTMEDGASDETQGERLSEKLSWAIIGGGNKLSALKKHEIARTVVKSVFNLFSKTILTSSSPKLPVFEDVDSLDDLKRALSHIVILVTRDFYGRELFKDDFQLTANT